MKTILAFETSSPILSVALGTPKGKAQEIRAPGKLQHSENLIPLMDRLLKREKLSLRQIDGFALTQGPGSFTGLRIGFSFLKGLLTAEKRPCYGALSLDMIAANFRLPAGSRLGVLVDARRERIYARFYERHGEDWRAERGMELLSLSELEKKISDGTHLAGDALLRYRKPLEATWGKQIHFLDDRLSYPRAITLVQWFQSRDSRLFPFKRPRDFLPLYSRAPEAEEKRREQIVHAA